MNRANTIHRATLIASGLFLAACAVFSALNTPPQGWNDKRGPVVPHESFPSDCSLCHVGEGWNQIREDFVFDHGEETGTVLVGAHADAECLRCHNDRGPVESFARRGCAGCHEDIHRGMLGKTCVDCHQEADWRPRAPIARHAQTRFPLVGAHASAACWRCHPGAQVGNFSRADTECVSCHRTDLARALNPDHQAMGWTSRCDRCHIPTSWAGSGFVHTAFPLTGVHVTLDCTDCHTGGMFTGTPSDCSACHISDFNATSDPDHQALMFSTQCEDCHSTSSWEGALFNHAGITMNCVNCHLEDYQDTTDPDHVAQGFATSCEDCHTTNSWKGAQFLHVGITSNCFECHQDDYLGTSNPNHSSAGFPTSCEDCHTTNSWQGAQFSHTGITSNCFECHASDYLRTSNPNHSSAGFPTSCETCHTTRSWSGASFNHSFPIQSGLHSGLSCSDCHIRPRNFAAFTCTDCHAHSQADMQDEHDRVPNYSYSSLSCLMCHPTGQE